MSGDPSPSVSTRERNNYTRVNNLLQVHGRKVLQNLFDSKHPPRELRETLASHEILTILNDLRDQRLLNTAEKKILYPRDSSTNVSSDNFDISLLAKLLRSICHLKSAEDFVWRRFPFPSDRSIEANIVRLREYKNLITSHSRRPSLDDATFEEYWANISNAIIALGGREGYASVISQLKRERMDFEPKAFSQELQETKAKVECLKGRLIPTSYSSS